MSEEEVPELELTYEGQSDIFVEARGAAHNFDPNNVVKSPHLCAQAVDLNSVVIASWLYFRFVTRSISASWT
eukprot:9544050-Prorocentrum_lima.AAC.1